MSKKRLHLHSLPLLVLAISLTGVLSVSVMAGRGNGLLLALVRPSLKAEPIMGGAATLSPNDQPAVEIPGAINQVDSSAEDISVAANAAQTIALQIILDKTVNKPK